MRTPEGGCNATIRNMTQKCPPLGLEPRNDVSPLVKRKYCFCCGSKVADSQLIIDCLVGRNARQAMLKLLIVK